MELQHQYVVDHEKNKCLKRPFKCDTCTKVLSFSNAPETSARRVIDGAHNSVGWGYMKFIIHAELAKRNIIKNDSLVF